MGEGHVIAQYFYIHLLPIIPRGFFSLSVLKGKTHIGLGSGDNVENDFFIGGDNLAVRLGRYPFSDNPLGNTPIRFHFISFVASSEEDAHHRHSDG
jgi:hypothetical protein